MTPIINPWFFYLIDIINGVYYFAAFIIVATIYIVLFITITLHPEDSETDKLRKKNNLRKCGIAILISALILVFVPKKETITKMLVAQNVTYERVEIVGNTVQEIYEDIISLLDKE